MSEEIKGYEEENKAETEAEETNTAETEEEKTADAAPDGADDNCTDEAPGETCREEKPQEESEKLPAEENGENASSDDASLFDDAFLSGLIDTEKELDEKEAEKIMEEIGVEKKAEDMFSDEFLDSIIDESKSAAEKYEYEEGDEKYEPFPGDDIERVEELYRPNSPRYYDDDDESSGSCGRMVLAMLAIILGIVAIVGVILFVGNPPLTGTNEKLEMSPEEPQGTLMPNVTGLPLKDAKEVIAPLGLSLKLEYEPSTQEADSVVKQSIPEGREIKKGDKLTLTIAKEKEKKVMNDYVGGKERPVANALKSSGYIVNVEDVVDESVDAGIILRTDPEAGSLIREGDTITLYVSRERETVSTTVPNVTGLSETEAIVALAEAHLSAAVKYEPNNMFYGRVIWQTIPANTVVEENTEVVITVGTQEIQTTTTAPQVYYVQPTTAAEPETTTIPWITVPKLTGYDIAQAVSLAEAAGLYVNVLYMPDDENPGYVINQDLPANSVVQKGSMINITVGE